MDYRTSTLTAKTLNYAFPEVQESLSFIDLKLLKKTFIIKRSTFLLFHPVGAPGSSLNLG